jgi:NhaA family Na+:H+ antiporter
VFVVAFAVMDDLAAVVVIAVFYTSELALPYLAGALGVFAILILMNRCRILRVAPYLAGGALMWLLMLRSGVHPTLSGVMLAFAVPVTGRSEDERSPSHRVERALHLPVAYFVLPTFALANTAVVIGEGALAGLATNHSLGVILGLLVGKPLGITAGSLVGVALGLCRLPPDLTWRHVGGAGFLGGIGFTMSIFITNLAFPGEPEIIDASKIAVLLASVTAGTLGFLWLRRS